MNSISSFTSSLYNTKRRHKIIMSSIYKFIPKSSATGVEVSEKPSKLNEKGCLYFGSLK